MGKWVYTHDGYKYNIEADDETSADEKFHSALKEFNNNKAAEVKGSNEEQNKVWDDKLKEATTPWGKVDAGMNAVFGRANRALEESVPGLKAAKEYVNPSLMKGVTVAKHYVPQTEALTKFENENPGTAKALNIAGGATAMLPLAAGAASVSGAGFIPQLAGQLAVNAPTNIADKMAEKGTTNLDISDASHAMRNSVLESLLPASATKLFGQAARIEHPSLPGGTAFEKFMQPGGHRLPSGATTPPPWAAGPLKIPGTAIQDSALAGLSPTQIQTLQTMAGGAAGYGVTHDIPGIIAGLAGAHYAHPIIDPIARGAAHVMRQPSTQDILRALSSQGEAHKLIPYFRGLPQE